MVLKDEPIDHVMATDLTFEDDGEQELKGIPDRWHLYKLLPS